MRWFAVIGLVTGLAASQAMAQAPSAPPLAGDWSGALTIGGRPVRLIFHVKGAPGTWTATLDSPDQGATGVPVVSINETPGGEVTFNVAIAHAAYTGRLSPLGSILQGQWTQGASSLPLTLVHNAPDAVKPKRPQAPVKPYPYLEEEVAYDNLVGHSHLTGTLTLPRGHGPFPVALMITGSGLQDRDETVFGHHPFLIWADYLTRRGIAVLRVDDRMMGGSTGDVTNATSADFATDVEAGVAYLKSRPDIDRRRIGLIGHSEGGVIAPMVAERDPGIAFIVLLAGSGEDGETLMLHQRRLIETALGLPSAAVDQSNANMRAIEDAVKDAPDQATADARLLAAWRSIITAQGGPAGTLMPAELRAVTQPWFRYFLSYDPRPTLARVRCPVLAVDGSRDLQVPAAENLAGIKEALKNNPDVTAVELPGLNHMLQTATTGLVREYGSIEETVSPLALTTVGDWVVAHVGTPLRNRPAPR
jgi:pimeloyl-ACP methyl ester carboxylesterase